MTAPAIAFAGDELAINFNRFGSEAYDLFLKVKRIPEYKLAFNESDESYTVTAPARFAELLGVERPDHIADPLPLSAWLYDDQAYIVRTALDAKRFAVWSDCGLGKTAICLEFARHVVHRTGGRFLIVTLNGVVNQWFEENGTFYGDSLPMHRIETRAELKDWCAGRLETDAKIGITNYEKFNHEGAADQVVSELRHLAGIALDESSRLKTGGGKQKWSIGKSAKGIEYKLSLTATPAPNNAMEFASQGMFLEKMRTESEIIWTFFSRNPVTQEWDVRPHAREAFFEFMASWSIYVRDPKRYGWRLTLPDVPEPEYIRVEIEPTDEQRVIARRILLASQTDEPQPLFVTRSPNAIERVKLSEVAKGFVYEKTKKGRRIRRIPSRKPSVVTRIVASEVDAGHQVLVWTVFDGESKLLNEHLDKAQVKHETLTGETAEADRVAILDRFRRGECRVLVSRAALLGFGMNFQCCTSMVFSGWTDSYEAFYQAVRRAVRHGQTERVRIILPYVRELEDETLANIDEKAARVEREVTEMENNYLRVLGRS